MLDNAGRQERENKLPDGDRIVRELRFRWLSIYALFIHLVVNHPCPAANLYPGR